MLAILQIYFVTLRFICRFKGAVKITPAHSSVDYNIAKSHDLPVISVINEDGLLNEHCGKYSVSIFTHIFK